MFMRTVRRILQLGKDLINWIVPVIVLAVAVFMFNTPVLLGIVLAVLVFAGLYFVLNQPTAHQERQEAIKDDVLLALQDARNSVAQMRAYGRGVSRAPVRERIMRICDLAHSTIDGLAQRDTDLVTARRIQGTFGQSRDILKLYVGLLRGQVRAQPAKRDFILSKIENDVLGQLETSLHDFALRMDQQEIISLEAGIRVLESTLRLEGLS